MDYNDVVDPIEKIMQELETENRQAMPPSPQPTADKPHRPIMMPPEIKKEPNDDPAASTQLAPSTAATFVAENTEAISHIADGAVAGHVEETQSDVPGNTFANGSNKRNSNTPADARSTEIASTPTAATPVPIRIKSESVEDGEVTVITTTAATPVVPIRIKSERLENGEVTVMNTTAVAPVVPIRIKSERLEDGELSEDDEQQRPNSNNLVSESQAAISKSQAEATLFTRIKPEPVESSATAEQPISTARNDKGKTPTTTVVESAMQPISEGVLSTMESNEPIGCALPPPDETLPDNYFDDLLQNADDITEAALQASIPKETSYSTGKEASTSTEEPQTTATHDAIHVKSEPADSSISSTTTTTNTTTQSAPIPEDYFDDLLHDQLAERIEDVVTHNLEIKYSERLKELEQLAVDGAPSTSKAHKKHKKKKKKSHKRSHAEAAMDSNESMEDKRKRSKRQERNTTPELTDAVPIQNPIRLRVKSEFADNVPVAIINLDDEEPSTSKAAEATPAMSVNQKRPGGLRIKSEFATFPMVPQTPTFDISEDSVTELSLPVRQNELFQRRTNVNRNGLIIDTTVPLGFKRIKLEKEIDKKRGKANTALPQDKMERAKQRAIEAIEAFKNAARTEEKEVKTFLYTPTIRKLPPSSSYFKQQIFENRSPLHNVNNVLYKFNSHANHFNLYEWGLEELPPTASKVAKILGYDIFALNKKLQTFKMPLNIQKIKKECKEQMEEKIAHPQSSFLITVATQTNDVTVVDAAAARRKKGHDIGTQTTGLPKKSIDDTPLMDQIVNLNENQLTALNDFVDLICEPVPEPSAIDLYCLRTRLMDIYKYSQTPSALNADKAPLPQPKLESTTNNLNSRDPRARMRAPLVAEVESPPPPTTTSKAASMAKKTSRRHHPQQQQNQQGREARKGPSSSSSSSLLLQQQQIPVITNVQSFHPSAPLLPPPSTFDGPALRYYGRGGMRR